MNGETFEVSFEKVCPACAADCPNLKIEEFTLFAESSIYTRGYYCANRDICKHNYERFIGMKEGADIS